tara:strand:- start:1852 stop:2604 length:753 start_codon:yes stop_codon:yes gene_type:complete
MALINRNTLKNYFKKGGFAKENHFVDLIDSSLNSVDDGIQVNKKDGLRLNPSSFSSRLISFFKNPNQENPEVSFNLNKDEINGFSIDKSSNKDSIIKIDENGKIGLNKNIPEYNLDVSGSLGVHSRIGTFKKGVVNGDGKWHDIVSNLDGINSFEINANISGKLGSGHYCVIHAIALSAFGGRNSASKINQISAFYKGYSFFNFRNKIILKWSGKMHNYNLQIKTRKNYGVNPDTGEPFKINFNVVKLLS